MKAIVAHAAKDLRIEDHETPSADEGQVMIRMEAGGICGSDLHYYQHGGFGTVRLKEPMILGHEVAGTIEEVGPGGTGLKVGQRVAVSPSRPCGNCNYCHQGMHNHCLNMRFYGSAMPEAAMAEPLSVVLHAAKRAGDLMGRRVLVTGCGPIGMLAILVARAAGAVEIVATDVAAFTLAKAQEVGADATHPQCD